MKDEIKEIILYLKKKENTRNIKCITLSEKDKLLDYITNLQEENEYLKKHQRFHKKFGNDYIFCVEGDKETYKDLLLEKQEELEDYKSRIEKAVEYMNNTFNITSIKDMFDIMNKLEDILEGKDNE